MSAVECGGQRAGMHVDNEVQSEECDQCMCAIRNDELILTMTRMLGTKV